MTSEIRDPPLFSFRSMRLFIVFMITLGLFATVAMRVNLSMAVVCMVNSTAVQPTVRKSAACNSTPSSVSVRPNSSFLLTSGYSSEDEDDCPNVFEDVESAQRAGYNGDLLWTPSMQSLLFSSTFYGALVTIGFSGYMADRFGPKMLLFAAALNYVLVTAFTPLLARWSYAAFFASRVLMGVGEGFIFPSLHSIVSRWIPSTERSTVAAMYTSGNQLAASLTSLIASGLCSSSFGWPSIFYACAAVGIAWCILWLLLASNGPSDNKWISAEEREYLERTVQNRGTKGSSASVPWRHIFTSVPFLVAVACQFSFNMQSTILQSFLPTYLKDSLHLSLQANGLYTTVPFVTQLVTKNFFGIFADYLKRSGKISHTRCAVLFQTISSFGTATLTLCLAFIPTCRTPQLAIPILGIYGVFFSGAICGFFTSIMSLAPNYTGTLGSLSMVAGMLGNLTGPLVLSLLEEYFPHQKWTWLFIISCAINMLTGALFLAFGSADVQPWAISLPSKVGDIQEEEEKKEPI